MTWNYRVVRQNLGENKFSIEDVYYGAADLRMPIEQLDDTLHGVALDRVITAPSREELRTKVERLVKGEDPKKVCPGEPDAYFKIHGEHFERMLEAFDMTNIELTFGEEADTYSF